MSILLWENWIFGTSVTSLLAFLTLIKYLLTYEIHLYVFEQSKNEFALWFSVGLGKEGVGGKCVL